MDPQSRIELREILLELRKLHKTILISSHILPELAEMCTHVGVMREGELLAEGPVGEILRLLSPGISLRVRLLAAADRDVAVRTLEAHPACREIGSDADSLVVARFDGSDQELADILSKMVGAGAQVTEYAVEGGTLQDVFMQVAAFVDDRQPAVETAAGTDVGVAPSSGASATGAPPQSAEPTSRSRPADDRLPAEAQA
jgi:ABC-2 type transport system ATP-binding protein